MISEINNIYFSIIICCFNSEKFISETINSILNQNYDKWELIIIDDGSEDNTEGILKKIVNNNPNKDIHYFKQENKGLANSRNRAVKLSKYDWIAIMDHDDICLPNRFLLQSQQIKTNTNCHLFFSDMIYFDNKNKFSRFKNLESKINFNPCRLNLKKNYAFFNLIRHGCFIGSSSVVFSIKSFRNTSGFDENYKFICDYNFFLEVALHHDIFCSDIAIVKWRMHSGQQTKVSNKKYLSEMQKLYINCYLNNNIDFLLKLKIFFQNIKSLIKLFLK